MAHTIHVALLNEETAETFVYSADKKTVIRREKK